MIIEISLLLAGLVRAQRAPVAQALGALALPAGMSLLSFWRELNAPAPQALLNLACSVYRGKSAALIWIPLAHF